MTVSRSALLREGIKSDTRLNPQPDFCRGTASDIKPKPEDALLSVRHTVMPEIRPRELITSHETINAFTDPTCALYV